MEIARITLKPVGNGEQRAVEATNNFADAFAPYTSLPAVRDMGAVVRELKCRNSSR